MKTLLHCVMLAVLSFMMIERLPAITFKLASSAPEATIYGETVKRIAARWNQVSNGRISIRIFHNGIAGDESDVIRKMRIGQIHIGILTSISLSGLADEFLMMSAPGLIRTDEEMSYIFDLVQPELVDALIKQRFQVLGWARPGWVYLFTDTSIHVPEELKALQTALPPSLEAMILSLRNQNFRAIPLRANEWLTGLNSGQVNAIIADPLLIAGLQVFTKVPYMIDVRLGPYLATFSISDTAWRRVPRDLQPTLQQIVEEEILALEIANREQIEQIITLMESYGLTRVRLSDEQSQLWFDAFSESTSMIFDSDENSLFNRIKQYLGAYRNSE